MECPVCGAKSAECIDPQSIDAKSFRCFECGDYEITGNTWELGLLTPLTIEERRKAFLRDRAVANSRERPAASCSP